MLVWGAVIVRRGGLLAGCMVVLLAGIIFGPPFFSLAGGPMPITIDRVLLGLLVIGYLFYRQLGWTEKRPMTAADAVALSLMCVLTINVFTHDWKLNRSQPLSYLVFFWFMPLAIYWVARHATIGKRGMMMLFGTFAALGVYLAVTAVCEAKGRWELVVPQYIVSLKFTEFLGRGRGPLLNPPGNGVLMALCLACGLMAWPRVGRNGRVAIACGFAPILLLGMYYTLTRSVWMGAAAALAVVVGLSMPSRWRMPVVACTMIASVVTVAVNWESLLAFKRDKNLTAAETADSTTLRPIFLYVALEMFRDRPIMGCGLAHYMDEQKPYLHDRSTELVLAKARPYVQHNAVLSLLVETGIAGLSAFLLLIALWLREAWKLWRCTSAPLWKRQSGLVFLALMAGYLPNSMFHDTTIIAMMNMTLFFWAGVVVNLATEPVALAENDDRSSADAQVEREWFGQAEPQAEPAAPVQGVIVKR